MEESTRITICGGPRVGKTTLGRVLAEEHRITLVSTDDFMSQPWAMIPDLVIERIRDERAWVLEGTQTARVLRRWLNDQGANPNLTSVYWLSKPLVELSDRQESMAKGVEKVFNDVRPKLHKLDVPIFPGLPPHVLNRGRRREVA
jgi:hypothetical protein